MEKESTRIEYKKLLRLNCEIKSHERKISKMGFKRLKNPSYEWRNRLGSAFLELKSIDRINELD